MSKKTYSLDEMKTLNQNNGGHFFDRETMRIFGSKVETPADENGYFITSETTDAEGNDAERAFTVRKIDLETGRVKTIGEGRAYASKAEANRAILKLTLNWDTRA